MRIDIDFAPRRRLPQPRELVLLAGGLLTMVAAGWSIYDAKMEQQAAAAELNHQVSRVSRVRPIDPATANAVNQAIRQLNLPWHELFVAIEASAGEQISLLSLEPDAARRVLRLSGEAKNASEMIDFVGRLQQAGFFAKVSLVRHEINEGDRNKPFRFAVEAEWTAE